MILPAQTIRRLCHPEEWINWVGYQYPTSPEPMIDPFCERAECNGVSYGLGPAGYDLRVDRDVVLYPGRSVRADAIERLCMPDDVMALLFTKSTWARFHVEHAGTTVDPGFRGVLRLEINMHGGSDTVEIRRGTGIVHAVFLRLEAPTQQPYRGKYQDQGADQDAIFSGIGR